MHSIFFCLEGFSSLTLILTALQSKLSRIPKCSGISSASRGKLDLKLIKLSLNGGNPSPVRRKKTESCRPPVVMARPGVVMELSRQSPTLS